MTFIPLSVSSGRLPVCKKSMGAQIGLGSAFSEPWAPPGRTGHEEIRQIWIFPINSASYRRFAFTPPPAQTSTLITIIIIIIIQGYRGHHITSLAPRRLAFAAGSPEGATTLRPALVCHVIALTCVELVGRASSACRRLMPPDCCGIGGPRGGLETLRPSRRRRGIIPDR